MRKKTRLFAGILLVLGIVTYIAFKLIFDQPPASSIASIQVTTAVVIDMDMQEKRPTTIQDINKGNTPILVLFETRADHTTAVRAIRSLDTLIALDTNHDRAITSSEAAHRQLGLAYLSHNKKTPGTIKIISFKEAGIRAIFFDPKLIPNEHKLHPNFHGAAGFAIMTDNTRRPVQVIDIPRQFITLIEKP